MMFSLICATIGRKQELEVLLTSLTKQVYKDFELIIVDQNAEGFLTETITKYSSSIAIKHIHTLPAGASSARNTGLSHAEGEIIGFPDDDCHYPEGLLYQILCQFSEQPDLDLFTGVCQEQSSMSYSAGRYDNGKCVLNTRNVWTRHILACLFVRQKVLADVGGFDSRLGVGRKFGSGEETDLILRILYKGYLCSYNSLVYVFHPDPVKDSSRRSLQRAFSYGLGWGALFRKHTFFYQRYGLLVFYLYSVFRSLAGCGIALIRFNVGKATYYAYSTCGRLWGFLTFKT